MEKYGESVKAAVWIAGIDPGPERSSLVAFDGERIIEKMTIPNEDMVRILQTFYRAKKYVVIEKITSYGMPVGESVFETVFWTGRFCQANPYFIRVPRKEVKLHFCNSARAKDSNIVQALKDRFEPDLPVGKRPKGILKGLKGDEWQAFALAVYYYDCLCGGSSERKNEIFQRTNFI